MLRKSLSYQAKSILWVTGLIFMVFSFSLNAATVVTAINGLCGAASGSYQLKAPWSISAAAACAAGSLVKQSGTGPWSWSCLGKNGGTSAYCAANLLTQGVCGAANNTPAATAPTTALCAVGSAAKVAVTDAGGFSWSCGGVGVITAQCSALSSIAQGAVLPAGSYTSNAASTESALMCSKKTPFPGQWTWNPASTITQPRGATAADNLTPRIDQVRNGQVIASYNSFGSNIKTCNSNLQVNGSSNPKPAAIVGCGAFGNVSHVDLYRLWQSGDTFLVYPAVYTGSENNIMITPRPDYYHDPVPHIPSNITIQGVTVNGIRPALLNVAAAGDFASAQAPVYIWNAGNAATNSTNITLENLDIGVDQNLGSAGKSGIYTNGATNLTLRQLRIYGFELKQGNTYGANGIFATSSDGGTLTIDQVELYRNGGGEGPAHNLYINASVVDPNYTVHMVNSWSHDAFYGHTFKSRAQNNILEGNYFQGGLPQGGIYQQAENYLVDIPNGGQLTMRNNILVKNRSGDYSNGASVTFAVEGVIDARAQAVDIENNTFVAFAATYDGSHPLWPFFFWHSLVPGAADFVLPGYPSGTVVPSIKISGNVFVGYCSQTYSSDLFMNYRGDLAVTEAFSELVHDFSFNNPVLTTITDVAGTPAYTHAAQTGLLRQLVVDGKSTYAFVGAEDQ